MTDGRSWRLVMPWKTPPLSLNDKKHWRAKAAIIHEVRDMAGWKARAAKVPPLTRIRVELEWVVPDNIHRDADNVVATLKPLCDGLVDAGLVPDDIPKYMDKLMPRIRYDKGISAVVLHVTELLD